MATNRGVPPNAATIGLVARLALIWAGLGLVAMVTFGTLVAPHLGQAFAFAIPGRGPTLTVPVDTVVITVSTIGVVSLAVVASVAAVLTAPRNPRAAYTSTVAVCIIVPGFVALVTASGLAAMAGGGDPTTGGSLIAIVAGVVGFGLGGVSVSLAPKFAEPAHSQ
jgi:hypothetical protein